MQFDFTPVLLLPAVVTPVAVVMGWHAWRHRSLPGALPFFVISLVAALWAAMNALELSAVGLEAKLLWSDLQYVSIVSIPLAWLAMAVDYTGRRQWLRKRNLLILSIIPVMTLVLLATDGAHHLVRASVWLDESGSFPVVGRVFGPWFWLHTAYSYLAVAGAVVLLASAVHDVPRPYRGQPIALLAGFSIPLAWNVAFVLVPGVLPAHDFTPALFGITGLVVGWGLFRVRLFTLVPIARHSVIENMPEALIVLDDANRVVDINKTGQTLLARPSKEILGRPLAESWNCWPQLASPYAAGSKVATIFSGTSSDKREYEVRISTLKKSAHVIGRLLIVHDVTERALMENSLRRQAVTDNLTGLPNRTLFMARLNDAVSQARRHPGTVFAVIILDLDRFKLINDSIGHLAGDVLLRSVAAKLKQCIREADMVARMGGDEFMILLDGIASTRDLLPVIERIQEELRSPVMFGQYEMGSSASLGVVLWDDSYQDPDELLRAADTAMYQAKEAGRACYRIFDERMHMTALRTLNAETELRSAIAHKDFTMAYQPIVDLKTGAVSSLEALVRWRHPNKGMVLPDEFISVAENSGLIVPLGILALEQVCSQLSRWQTSGHPLAGIPVSLNISPRQLTETDFLANIAACLSEWQVPAQMLELELTETALIRDPLLSQELMHRLRAMGIKLCLDDFGTGWSSLKHLTTFPVQELKIDRSFVAKIARSTEFEIVRSITALAHTLGLTVTGEGVEDAEQLRLLEELGCDSAQGFYVGRPMPPDSLISGLGTCRSAMRDEPHVPSKAAERETDTPGVSEPIGGEHPMDNRDIWPQVWYHPAPLCNE